jgi:hypothetical protein
MNKEEIELLEDVIKEYKMFGDLDNPKFEDKGKIYKAIENLIARNKELERINLDYDLIMTEQYKHIENSIPKSVIKEKIEELKENGYWEFNTNRDLETTIQVLEELLEDK